MAQIDAAKEDLGYLKFWQGVVVVTDISLIGWLISTADQLAASIYTVALIGAFLLSLGIYVLHRQIAQGIDSIGRL